MAAPSRSLNSSLYQRETSKVILEETRFILSHNHCQSKLHQNCSWWKFYTPKTRFWVIGEKRNSLQLAYLPLSEGMDVNSLRAQPLPVWSTFVISNVGHQSSRNTRWMDTWTQSRPQKPSGVFSSRSSTSNPSFCSFLKWMFSHSFLSSSSPLLSSSSPLLSSQATLSIIWRTLRAICELSHLPPSFSAFSTNQPDYWREKPNQIKCFCCLNSIFQLFHLLSCSLSPVFIDTSYFFPPSF